VGPAAEADRPLVRWADDPAPAPAPAARSSWEDAEDWSDRETRSDRASVLTPPELVERDSFDDTTNVAAVQILGVGKARALSPTLELGDASGADEEPEYDDPADGDDPGLRVSFEEPEYDAGPRAAIPALTADVEPDGESLVVVTQDGLQHRDGAAVADADVDASQLKHLLSDARAAEARGNLQEAVLHYGDLLSLQPSNLEAHLGRGRSLVELGDYAAAMSDFQRAEDIAPHSPDPIVEMGNLFFARKEYRKSITYYDQAVEMAPDHAMAWCRRGICHHYRKNHSQAFKDLQKAVSLDPDIPNLRKYVQMARKAMERGER
jgi:tetratricopeptide (TPR) repeat protein